LHSLLKRITFKQEYELNEKNNTYNRYRYFICLWWR